MQIFQLSTLNLNTVIVSTSLLSSEADYLQASSDSELFHT